MNPRTAIVGRCRPNLCLCLLLSLMLAVGSAACSRKSTPVDTGRPAEAAAPASESATRETRIREKFERAIAALAARDDALARRLFGEIVSDDPQLSGPYANLALIDFRQQQFDQARTRVDKAIELNPRNPQAFHLRAQIRLHHGEIEQARQDYERAIELDPEYLNAHYNLALLYDIYLQEIALAIEHYSIYLSLLGKPDEILQDWINHLRNSLDNG